MMIIMSDAGTIIVSRSVQLGASLTDDSISIIYDRKLFKHINYLI
jgi:hypothetical protein